MSITRWTEPSDKTVTMSIFVLRNLSIDNIPVSYDMLDFKCSNVRKSNVDRISEIFPLIIFMLVMILDFKCLNVRKSKVDRISENLSFDNIHVSYDTGF